MTATLATLSPLLRPNVSATPATSLVFLETDYINWLRGKGRFVAKLGGAPYKFNLATGENGSAETYVENQPPPAAGHRSYAQGSVAAWYVRTVAAVTGHVRDNMAGGGFYEDPQAAELASGVKALMLKVEQTLEGATYGMPTVIDANDAYAGIDPATVPAWASYEHAVGGAQTLAHLALMYLTLVNRGASPTDILTSQAQIDKYIGLANIAHATASPVFIGNLPSQGATFDMGMVQQMPRYNGVPFSRMRNQTASELYMLDTASGTFQVSVHRDVTTEPLAKVNDNTEWQITMACCLEVGRRDLQGKQTGLT